jgi:hypothetical protein
VTTKDSERALAQAEAKFKKLELQRVEGAKAWADYHAERVAEREKTARLRALRLARDAALTTGDAVAAPGRTGKTRTH